MSSVFVASRCPCCAADGEIELSGTLGRDGERYVTGDEVRWARSDFSPGWLTKEPRTPFLLSDFWGECEGCGVNFFVPVVAKRGVLLGVLEALHRDAFGPDGAPPRLHILVDEEVDSSSVPKLLGVEGDYVRLTLTKKPRGVSASQLSDHVPCGECKKPLQLHSWREAAERGGPLRFGSHVRSTSGQHVWGTERESTPGYAFCKACDYGWFLPMHSLGAQLLGPMMRAVRPGTAAIVKGLRRLGESD